ncbi:hypothetical protein ISR94_00395 [Candidatus Microgenomates bacterium]|nr:hypothetical protein [Candidatus Microgenomates bacterium]
MIRALVYINLVVTLCLVAFVSWFFIDQRSVPPSHNTNTSIEKTSGDTSNIDSCGEECKKQIQQAVSSSLATISADTSQVVATAPTVSPPTAEKTQYAYIPLSGPVTTTSTEWTDMPGTDFYLNLNVDYGKDSYVTWAPSLKVAHGNGVVAARIYDVTNKISVNGSEVSVSNESDLTQVESGSLSFWAGNNLYRVQLKSLNTFEVTFGSGRIKIAY